MSIIPKQINIYIRLHHTIFDNFYSQLKAPKYFAYIAILLFKLDSHESRRCKIQLTNHARPTPQ